MPADTRLGALGAPGEEDSLLWHASHYSKAREDLSLPHGVKCFSRLSQNTSEEQKSRKEEDREEEQVMGKRERFVSYGGDGRVVSHKKRRDFMRGTDEWRLLRESHLNAGRIPADEVNQLSIFDPLQTLVDLHRHNTPIHTFELCF